MTKRPDGTLVPCPCEPEGGKCMCREWHIDLKMVGSGTPGGAGGSTRERAEKDADDDCAPGADGKIMWARASEPYCTGCATTDPTSSPRSLGEQSLIDAAKILVSQQKGRIKSAWQTFRTATGVNNPYGSIGGSVMGYGTALHDAAHKLAQLQGDLAMINGGATEEVLENIGELTSKLDQESRELDRQFAALPADSRTLLGEHAIPVPPALVAVTPPAAPPAASVSTTTQQNQKSAETAAAKPSNSSQKSATDEDASVSAAYAYLNEKYGTGIPDQTTDHVHLDMPTESMSDWATANDTGQQYGPKATIPFSKVNKCEMMRRGAIGNGGDVSFIFTTDGQGVQWDRSIYDADTNSYRNTFNSSMVQFGGRPACHQYSPDQIAKIQSSLKAIINAARRQTGGTCQFVVTQDGRDAGTW